MIKQSQTSHPFNLMADMLAQCIGYGLRGWLYIALLYIVFFDAPHQYAEYACLTLLSTSIKSTNKVLIIQLLDKCLRGNKIAPLQHTCLTSLGICAKGVQCHCPSRTYACSNSLMWKWHVTMTYPLMKFSVSSSFIPCGTIIESIKVLL